MSPEELIQALQMVVVAGIMGLVAVGIAKMRGFFSSPPWLKGEGHGTFVDVTIALALFLFIQVVVLPTVAFIVAREQGVEDLNQISEVAAGWLQVVAIVTTALVLLAFWATRSYRRQLWEAPRVHRRRGHDVALGIAGTVISYPWILIIGQTVTIAVALLLDQPQPQQIAVEHFIQAQADPRLYAAMVACIVVVVPVTEELLFRGFLQGWFQHYLSPRWAIVLTSALFAAFHFSPPQGITNLALVPSLFILSCFLGHLYRRQQSLWAPIALHVSFNLASVSLILLGL